jgi:hypothetical protein
MLTKEQWENLKRFAGVGARYWMPHEDWRDFGPLWVKLNRWLGNYPKDKRFPTIEVVSAYQRFQLAVYEEGTESDLMQAGCALGAAIGATMKPALAADKETP